MSPVTTGIVCNPMDLAYRFQDVSLVTDPSRRAVFREAADPSIVRYRDRYFLFASMSRGFWHSVDLVTWEFRTTEKLPALDYAPDVREIDGALIISASRRGTPCPFFRSENPLDDDFVEATPGSFDFWDPNLFQDDDGETYFYWGCSSETPLYGTRIDRSDFDPLGERVEVLASDVLRRGWEAPGENNVEGPRVIAGHDVSGLLGARPFIEGAWMDKCDGIYYLQYAAPGTEYNTYADGYLTSDSPLGPFEYSEYSPFSAKPGGFITGAGHGSTFQDEYGNWWHASTMRISVNHIFERRVGLFPAGFDDDGVLFCNQNFADYPMRIPRGECDPWTDLSTGWMLLSYGAQASASSALPGHPPTLATDEDVRSWWVAGSAQQGEWIAVDLGVVQDVHAVQVNLADHDLVVYSEPRGDGAAREMFYRAIDPVSRPTELVIETSTDGETWMVVEDTRGSGRETPHAFFVWDEPRSARYVRVTGAELPFSAPLAVSAVRVFGIGNGAVPEPAAPVARRVDERTAEISWSAVPGAVGYNVRYGSREGKLYHSWLLYDQSDLVLRGLNAGAEYWVAVDAFNTAGVREGTTIPILRQSIVRGA